MTHQPVRGVLQRHSKLNVKQQNNTSVRLTSSPEAAATGSTFHNHWCHVSRCTRRLRSDPSPSTTPCRLKQARVTRLTGCIKK